MNKVMGILAGREAGLSYVGPSARSDWQVGFSWLSARELYACPLSRVVSELDILRIGQGSQTVPMVRKRKCHFI